jgi:hypothetical protein
MSASNGTRDRLQLALERRWLCICVPITMRFRFVDRIMMPNRIEKIAELPLTVLKTENAQDDDPVLANFICDLEMVTDRDDASI